MSNPQDPRRELTVPALVVVMIALMSLASLYPQVRLGWGLGIWSHIPWPFLTIAAVAAITLAFTVAWGRDPLTDTPLRLYWFVAAMLITVFTSMYVLFPAQTHFLGDGYQVLAQAGAGASQIKYSAWGEGIVRAWLYDLMKVTDTAGALTAYRIVAAVAGCLFLFAAAVAAGRLYNRSSRGLVFLLGLSTGGWTLLYFGYVEHYALFVTSVGLYCFAGLLALRGHCSRWWAVPLMILATTLHIFGAVLLVPTLYLLLADRRPIQKLAHLRPRTAIVLVTLTLLCVIAGTALIRQQHDFLRYSLLPVFADPFSYDNYSIVDLRHLTDLTNLLLLLVPALPLAVALIVCPRPAKMPVEKADVFLVLCFVSASVTALVLDPKLGMPRDWDLFSFAAIPATLLMYLIILRRPDPTRLTLSVAAVAIALFALSGRVIALNVPDTGAERFKDYLTYDHQRHLRSWYHLGEYYRISGDSAKYMETKQAWATLYPERVAFSKALELWKQDPRLAARLLTQAAALNPTYTDAWAHLGAYYADAGMYDSAQAVLGIAIRLNPDEPSAQSNMGVSYLDQKKPELALKYLQKAHALKPDEPMICYNLALSHLLLGQEDRFVMYIEKAAALPSATSSIHINLGDWYAHKGDFPRAASQYRLALDKGEPPATISDRGRRFPALAQYIRMAEPAKTD